MGKIKLSDNQILEHLDVIDSHVHLPYRDFRIPANVTDTQDIAKAMMNHVGLNNYEPIIKYEDVQEGTAGHICLNNNSDHKVYITLSSKTKFIEAELATLAHEVCHKLLYVHNCYFPMMGDYNESLADIATIYAGFGKYVLQGCEISRTHKEYQGTENWQTTTTTYYTGYLDYFQFELAYQIVCFINNIPTSERYRNPNKSNSMLKDCWKVVGEDKLIEQYSDFCKKILSEDAASMNILLQQEKFVADMKQKVIERQRKYIQILDAVKIEGREIQNPYKALQIMNDPNLSQKLSAAEEQKTTRILQPYRDDFDIYSPFYMEYHAARNIVLDVVCPSCGFTKTNAISERKKLLIRCPKCKHIFYWDASTPQKREVKTTTNIQNGIKYPKTWKDKIKALFK